MSNVIIQQKMKELQNDLFKINFKINMLNRELAKFEKVKN